MSAVTVSRHADPGRSIASGALTGVSLARFLDETIFHQLLHRHRF